MATCKIIKNLGTIIKSDKAEMKLQLISWNGEDPVYDIRIWLADGKAMTGLAFTKEELLRLKKLCKGIDTEFSGMNDPEDDDEEVVLTKPKRVTKTKATKTMTKTTTKAAKKEVRKAEVIKFPKPKEDIEKAETSGTYTYEDCEAKFDKMFEPVENIREYADMLMGLKEMAKVDDQFIQNAMREDRTFEGMMKYFYSHAKNNSICVGGNVYCMDDDLALAIFLDYFNEK